MTLSGLHSDQSGAHSLGRFHLFKITQFEKHFAIFTSVETLKEHMMVRRMPDRFIGEYSGYFSCLCVIYWFVNVFVH